MVQKDAFKFRDTPLFNFKSCKDLKLAALPCRFTKVNLSTGTSRANFAIAKFGLIIIFIFAGAAQCATPVYGLQLSEKNYSEALIREEADSIAQEKERIMESAAPAREEREKNLHPFVEGGGPSELQTPAFDSTDSPSLKPSRAESRDNPGYVEKVDFTVRANAAVKPEIQAPLINAPASNLKPNAGINFPFILIILAAFLLAHFFIQPKSR